MDKYEYNLKLEEIDKLVDQGDYEEAAKLADTIDWRRVRNVRTLCLISEIYEASGRLEESKNLLLRAYRRSPSGRSILYRLVEVTTAMKQYDEALEFYTEYVQAAPHDNNRFILKYKIYKGRGADPEELISILEEYLGQEYTEKWAYELASLYQQSGQIQKCLATCDDLVLWFHSGKYVIKALELKKRYAALTPKQQEIYDQRFLQEEDEASPEEDLEENVIRNVESTDGEVLAESILAETEKQIAGEVAARKAELEREASRRNQQFSPMVDEEPQETEPSAKQPDPEPEAEPQDEGEAGAESGRTDYSPENLQMELAKSMREIISGVVKHTSPQEEDIPASVEKNLQMPKKVTVPEPDVKVAGKLSIDDILLSMGDKGKELARNRKAREEEEEAEVLSHGKEPAEESAAEENITREDSGELREFQEDEAVHEEEREYPEEEAEYEENREYMEEETEYEEEGEYTEEEAGLEETGEDFPEEYSEEGLTEDQKEALRYTDNPEKLLKNKDSMPVYRDEPQEDASEDLSKTQRIVNTKEELQKAAQKELLAEKTIRIPTEEVARRRGRAEEEPTEAQRPEEYPRKDGSDEASYEEVYYEETYEEEYPEENEEEDVVYEEDGQEEGTEEDWDEAEADKSEAEDGEWEEEEPLMIPAHLRNLFSGFTEIEGLEEQIANAIIQAEAKGGDRTSKNGNILIFGPHGSGKTTLAMNIAKAIAQDRGNQVMKMAKIYAADLNRKDIAATIAKIAGGTLIIEEAGDLEDGTVEQLTTAMEFRTDGLIMILEDEQQYIHELLMQHPRFTMKFTAQIYIPVYTVEELAMFGQLYANEQDFVISDEGMDRLEQKLSDLAEQGENVSINDAIGIVSGAIRRSNKFFRKMALGKKRYDDQDYIILFAKDFK